MVNSSITKNSPVGIFDSGVGGLSVVNTIRRMLPFEDVIYFGDNLNAPYGIKTVEEVEMLSFSAIDFLVRKGAKAIVIACNTATSAAAEKLRSEYDMIIIGMEPAVNLAVSLDNRSIGVFATELTLREQKYRLLVDRLHDRADIYDFPAPKLVKFVEEGFEDYKTFKSIIDEIVSGSNHSPLDSVVLGCTHYVFLEDYFKSYFGDSVSVLSGNDGTVRHLKRSLEENGLLNDDGVLGSVKLYSSLDGVDKMMDRYVR